MFSQQSDKLLGNNIVQSVPTSPSASVALSADGNTAIIGRLYDNNDTGAVWIFTRDNGTWAQQGPKLIGSGAIGPALQGASVAVSADGNTAMVGGPGDNAYAGAVWVFTRNSGVWTQQGPKLIGASAYSLRSIGSSVALSADGNTAIAGGPDDNNGVGASWVFTRFNGVWAQQGQKLVGSGATKAAACSFIAQGGSVALSADGNTAIAGGSGDNGCVGAAWVFTRNNGIWTQQGPKLVASLAGSGTVGFGASVVLSADGNTVIVGGPGDNSGTGAVWVFTRNNGVWTQQGPKLIGSGAYAGQFSVGFGASVALSADGNTAIAGGPHDDNLVGSAWVFTRLNGVWTQQGSKLAGFGSLVALSADGNTAIVGSLGGIGAAWVLGRNPVPTVALMNAASSHGGPITPGEIITLYGTHIGPTYSATLALDKATGKVATTIGGVQVLINGYEAPMIYASSTQINAVVPYEIGGSSSAIIQVSYLGQISNAVSLTTTSTAPGLFTSDGSGSGPAAAINQDNSLNGPKNPAPKGSYVVLYLTGEGQTSAPGVTGRVTTVSAVPPLTPQPLLPIAVLINGQPALVAFYGEAPGLVSGVMQINVQIPVDAPAGNLPIQVSVGGNSSQNGVTVSVR
jgi:uncharacterized protein (TIGR03437 family)